MSENKHEPDKDATYSPAEKHQFTGFKRLRNMLSPKEHNGHAEPKASEDLDQKLKDIKEMGAFIRGQNCPACNEKQLKLFAFERGPTGWEAGLECNACGSTGIFNKTGLHFERGAKDQEPKK